MHYLIHARMDYTVLSHKSIIIYTYDQLVRGFVRSILNWRVTCRSTRMPGFCERQGGNEDERKHWFGSMMMFVCYIYTCSRHTHACNRSLSLLGMAGVVQTLLQPHHIYPCSKLNFLCLWGPGRGLVSIFNLQTLSIFQYLVWNGRKVMSI